MLGNFVYHNPTKLIFGKDSLDRLGSEIKNYGKNILVVYGGGSIKKMGLYDKVVEILKANDKNVFDLAGVMPNPTIDKVYEGVEVAKANNIDFILAVGGGSVIDYSKSLAAAVYSKEDIWEKYFVQNKKVDTDMLPIGAILTMVGTGSEMNGGSVISNPKLNIKMGYNYGVNSFPKFAILNPEFTYSVPEYQMVAGIYDIMSHILEQYLSGDDDNVSDYIMEGLMRSLIHSGRVAKKSPKDYEARSNIMWAATWALNTFVGKGKTQDWMVHMLGHAISAHTDATHGMTLASVSIPYYENILQSGLHKFVRFAKVVWEVNPNGKTDEEVAREGLQAMESWMKELGIVLNSRELGVTEENVKDIAEAVFILEAGYKTLTKEEVIDILTKSMR